MRRPCSNSPHFKKGSLQTLQHADRACLPAACDLTACDLRGRPQEADITVMIDTDPSCVKPNGELL